MKGERMMRDVNGFERSGEVAAERLKRAGSVLIIGHIDADGITASSIASVSLRRARIENSVHFVKKLDEAAIKKVHAHPADTFWFVDLGSAMLSKLDEDRCIITDHHRPEPLKEEVLYREGHVNPHLFRIDGSTEVSASGVTYMVAKKMNPQNQDLSAMAVVGAVGDFQESAEGRLIGYNRSILDDAVALGLIRAEKDVRLFGRETRPLPAFLQYSSDPALLPFITHRRRMSIVDIINEDRTAHDEDHMECIDLVRKAGVEIVDGGSLRTWSQLTRYEKRRVVSAVVERIIEAGKGVATVRRLIGEVYSLSPDLPGSPPGWLTASTENDAGKADERVPPLAMRAVLDAKEFATLLNACGRHDRPEVGLAVCLGDRGKGLEEALRQQEDHRQSLRRAIDLIRCDPEFGTMTVTRGGTALSSVRYFNARDRIEDTILGTVAGILIGTAGIPADRPLIGFALSGDGTCTIKVSGRGTPVLTAMGLDLASAMREASTSVGGAGGGHNVAAGATIPEGKEEEFLLIIDRLVNGQLSPSA